MATLAAPRPRLEAERRFYLGMALAILLTVFAGFGPSFYLRGVVPPYHPYLPMTSLVLLHGLIFSSWVLLFMTQVSLMSAGKAGVHMRLGIAGFVLLPTMIVVGALAALHGVARHSGDPNVAPLSWLAVPLLDIPVFTGLILAGLLNRSRPQVHKRFMLGALIGLLPPSIGRLPWPEAIPFPVIIIGGQLAFLVPLAIWDIRTRGKVHWATITIAAVLTASWLFRLAIWETPQWLAFARWAVSLIA
jgi:hypothetical protein